MGERVSAKDHVCNIAMHHKVEILAVGLERSYRRKSADANVLGSTSDLSLRRAFCTSLLVKPDSLQMGRAPQHFLVYIDGTDESHEAFKAAESLMGPADKLTAVHIADMSKQLILPLRLQWKNVKIRYADHFGTVVQLVDRNPAHGEAESILEQVAIYKPNYLVVGVDSMREWEIGSALEHQLSDQIVAGNQRTKSCNVIVAPLKSD